MIPGNYTDEEVHKHVLNQINNGDMVEEDIRALLARFAVLMELAKRPVDSSKIATTSGAEVLTC